MAPQICLTGNETSLSQLEKRFSNFPQEEHIHEVRVDFFSESLDDLRSFVEAHRGRILVTLRSVEQGGEFRGSPAEAIAILNKLALAKPAWLDVESGIPTQEIASGTETRILLSHHDFHGIPTNFSNLVKELATKKCHAIKIAVTTNDAADLWQLLAVRPHLPPNHQLIGMGFSGVLSRARFEHFGNLWTYIATQEAIAPGQLDWNTSQLWGLPQSAAAPFFSLVGGAQIAHSPGPRIYNTLFRRRHLPWSYIPAQTTRAHETFALLQHLGALGTSVTMPHKEKAFLFATPDSVAQEASAANTLRFLDERTECTLTDVDGVREPLRAAGVEAGENALILGAGGTARAAWLACRSLGLRCIVAARNPQKARPFFEDKVSIIPWEERVNFQGALLVNTTPVAQVWPDTAPLAARIVMDAALSNTESLLLLRAMREGKSTIAPQAMWLAQGQAQLKWLTGIDADLT